MADDGRRRRLCFRGFAAAGGVVLIVAATLVKAGAAELPVVFVGDAAASGARISFIVPGQFAVEEIVDGGGPFARSHLDSVGGSSDAAFPYPGGAALAYQGFVALTGITSPFAYPAYVQASNPGTSSSEVADPSGTYHLAATAEPGRTTGLAQMQGGSAESILSGASATTSAVKDGEAITVTAENVAHGLQFGKDLTLSSARSKSVTTHKRDASEPVTATEFSVDGLQIGGVKFGVTPEGFVVLGQPVPTPASAINDQIAALLKPSGLSLRFIVSTTSAGGAEAAALEITGTSPPGPNGATGTFTIRLGGAKTSIRTGEGLPGLPPLDSVGAGTVPLPESPPAPSADTPVPVSNGQSGGVQVSLPESSSIPLALPSDPFTPPAPVVESAAPPAVTEPMPASPQVAMQPIVRPKRVGSVDWLLTVLLMAGATMVLLAAVSKRSGETQPWAG